ncbi:ral guanine nucleotide dissociation stimulator-like isoform X1 [Equus caballus]|uniref:ral guanine nucleotide dissociation stimulator-like isoform X1 n=3 Tax=Equus caballus TaxID=9796 RepID=UPI0038B36F53
MFSCCLPSCGGSGFRKAKKKRLFSHYRHWLGPHLHRLCPTGRRSTQRCMQEAVEELADGFRYSISLDRAQLHPANNSDQGCSESSTQEVVEELTDGFGYSISLDRDQLHHATINNQGCSESEDESTLSVTEACRMRALQAGMMQRLSESVVPAFPSRVLCSVITSLCSYSGSSTAHQVLDQLFPRSHLPSIPADALIPFGTHGGSLAHCVQDAGRQHHLPNAIYFLLGTWLGQGQDCREPLQFPCWTLQLATLHVSFGGSHVEDHAYLLPGHLEHLKAIEAKQKEPAPKLLPHPEPEPEPEPAPGLQPSPLPAPPPMAELEPASPASDPTGLEEGAPLASASVPAPELEPTGPWAVTTENQLREEKLNILDFPPRLVAEQLTRMEAELFKKLVPAHCLGSIWSQRDRRDHKFLAPTIRDTVAHTNTLANSVIATCLGALGMTAQDRARMVELWIHVAEGCLGLRNFASFHTIFSALQSPAIKRLKHTWGQVSRERSYTFKKWCRGQQHVSKRLFLKEATSVLATAQRGRHGARERRRQQGVIPSLEMIFSYLELLHDETDYYVEGNVLSCRNEEFKFIKDIEMVQKAANLYTVQPDEHLGAWFQAVEPLSEEASYSLSCQLEPRYQWTRKIRLFFKDKKSQSSSRPGLNTRPPK